jgi:hypothetical protein
MFGYYVLLDGFSAHEVLLDYSFYHLGGAGVIPHTLRINYSYRSMLTDPKTVGLGAVDASFTSQF